MSRSHQVSDETALVYFGYSRFASFMNTSVPALRYPISDHRMPDVDPVRFVLGAATHGYGPLADHADGSTVQTVAYDAATAGIQSEAALYRLIALRTELSHIQRLNLKSAPFDRITQR
jgi:hypothetical protein